MSAFAGPEIINDGMSLCLDAASAKSYPGTGTSWYDVSGNGNHGTLTNSPTYSAVNGGVFVFDGTDKFANVGNPAILNTTTAITIDSWVKLAVINTRMIYCGKGNGQSDATTQYWLEVNASNVPYFYISIGGLGKPLTMSTFTIQAGIWYNIVGTYDGTIVRGYVNNVPNQTTISYAGSITTTVFPYSVGKLSNYTGLYLNGSIGVSRIYNRALSAAEISQNFNALRGRYGV